jgi:O-antigen ligase
MYGATRIIGSGSIGAGNSALGKAARGHQSMLVQSDRSHRVQQILERVTVGALYMYAVCSVISISAMQAAYISALVSWAACVYLQGHTRQLYLPLLMPFGAFALASALATIMAVEPFHSLVEFRNVFEALLFYLVVNQVTTEARATALTRVLIASGTVMALYSLEQSLAHGPDFRVHGTMSTYMHFAGLIMLVGLKTLAQLLWREHRRQILWALPALLLSTASLVMTHTRSAWLGFMVGCCVLLGLHKKAFLLLLPLLVAVVFFLGPQAIKTRALSLLDQRGITIQERRSMWSSGLHIIRDHPWTGVGMGAMVRMYQRYREPDSPVDPTRHIGHLHNNLIQVAAERGLLGLACWLWIWLAYAYETWGIYRRLGTEHTGAKALVLGSLASVVAFHVEGLFEHNFGTSVVVTLVYFLMALPFVVQRAYGNDQTLASGVVVSRQA